MEAGSGFPFVPSVGLFQWHLWKLAQDFLLSLLLVYFSGTSL
jgi:hypothetical protein